MSENNQVKAKAKNSSNKDYFDDFEESQMTEESSSGKSDAKENFAQLLSESFKKNSSGKKRFSVGEKVKAEVLVVGREEVFVSLGGGASSKDGIAFRRDFEGENGELSIKTGDKIDLYITQFKSGQIYLSPKASAKSIADGIEDAFDTMTAIEGRVAEVCKGGFRVSIHGKLAFCPMGQMDVARIEKPEEYIGQKFEFMVTQYSENGRNIVVSRRKLLDEERTLSVGAFLQEHRAGDVVKVKVAKLEKFGAFVELAPGLQGLVHISEISSARIADPSEVLAVGQEISAKIIKVEHMDGKTKVALSVKQAGDALSTGVRNPWLENVEKYPIGSHVVGKIDRKEPYGVFVKIASGFTGLLPKSRVQESSEIQFEGLKVGADITVAIADYNHSEHRISLALPKDASVEDWQQYQSTQKENKKAAPSASSFGNIGAQLQAALAKKK